jgi:hypothetical protein
MVIISYGMGKANRLGVPIPSEELLRRGYPIPALIACTVVSKGGTAILRIWINLDE